jgi:hypothetical protein
MDATTRENQNRLIYYLGAVRNDPRQPDLVRAINTGQLYKLLPRDAREVLSRNDLPLPALGTIIRIGLKIMANSPVTPNDLAQLQNNARRRFSE